MKLTPHIKTEGVFKLQRLEIKNKNCNEASAAYRKCLVKFEKRNRKILGCLSQRKLHMKLNF